MRRGTAATTMVVAGVMSGTSADGVDVAICHISGRKAGSPMIEIAGHRSFAYSRPVRRAVLAAMDARATTTAELSRLHWRLGNFYAQCVTETSAALGLTPQLVGCHGQTIYHQATAVPYLGSRVRCTWQLGAAAPMAERLRCPVASDFRAADLAAGGQGAPLVPMLDWTMFGHPQTSRVLLNLGGIANITLLPAGARPGDVLAFDTGPANMVIDGCMRRLYGRELDRDGAVARRGRVQQELLRWALRNPFFAVPPPKSCGREQFGEHFCERFVARGQKAGAADADLVATATALTAASIAAAYDAWAKPSLAGAAVQMFASGGGARNRTLLSTLAEQMQPAGVSLAPITELGVNEQAKEAVAFALLAWLTWQGRPGNLPSATGAGRPMILGQICFG